MFDKLSLNELLANFDVREKELKSTEKIHVSDQFYLLYLSKYKEANITPDLQVFGYESALSENNYLNIYSPNISRMLWKIGRTGQGDSWFMSKQDGDILFYDHNCGENDNLEHFKNLNISFLHFLQMSFLYQELENVIDEHSNVDEVKKTLFKEVLNAINKNLYESYPFKYW